MTGMTKQVEAATQLGPPGAAVRVRTAAWTDRRFGGLSPAFWQLFWGIGIARLGWVVIPFRTFYLAHHRHLDPEQVSLIMLAFGVGWAVSQPAGGWFADRFGRRIVLVASAFGSAGAYVFFGAASEFVWLAVWAGAVGLTFDLYRPALSALISDSVHADRRPDAPTP